MRRSVFHEDWWLDAVAPGCWREVRCARGGHIAGYLRFVERTKAGMTTCEMPQITRFLGPVLMPHAGKTEARTRATHSILSDLLDQIAGHDHVHMTLDTGFQDVATFINSGYEAGVQPTFLLDCNRPPDELWAGLRDKARNLIRRARERLTVREIDDVERFIAFYRANLYGSEPYFNLSLIASAYAAAHARGQCRILAATDHDDVPHAMVFLVWDNRYVHFFLATRNRYLSHLGAVSLLLWTGIEFAQSHGLTFDFDGGVTTHARYRFMVAFGGELANRFEITRSTTRYRVQHMLRRIPGALARRIALAPRACLLRHSVVGTDEANIDPRGHDPCRARGPVQSGTGTATQDRGEAPSPDRS